MDTKTKNLDPVFRTLEQLYRGTDRHYHNMGHIQDMLVKLSSVRHLAEYPDRIQLAIWFHDAVYDSHRQDNEVKSAVMWTSKMSPFLSAEVLQWGRRAILATIDHLPNSDPDIQLLLDLDLSRLGAPWEVFESDREAIRKEYAHVDEETFQKKTALFFRGLLKRPTLYGTEYWHNLLDKEARKNMERVIA